ncbi:hypothetical protein NLX71_02300 [Paenibacillus sp. MZ04-78.2]|uniref:hypothetical protein n=1 Tax=Paenibacillus sp. MZ04-78.2 TaxID=2962034 RepID=UPI0020B898E3|nr:hypothetical protein [Paenibacillus sp. MZ04-78.2]MCP3772151.1 hypothetical protein [Paenibacillus sp. MZ04-78.2]
MKKKDHCAVRTSFGAGGGRDRGAYYYNIASKYITTEDAKVQGDLRAIGSHSDVA